MPITRDQFSLQVDRLVDAFGEKAFSEQREYMIWQVVDGLDYAHVIAIVDQFIRGSRNAPLPADFAVASEGLGRTKRALGEYSDNPACGDCFDSGFVHVVRNAEHEAWAKADSGSAPCHCVRGKLVIEALKRGKNPVDLKCQWNEQWAKSYQIAGRG